MPTLYHATEQEDGTFRIRDVPILTLLPKDSNRQAHPEVDQRWLERALQYDQFRRSVDGYKATAHIGHHDAQTLATSGVQNVGFVELVRVGAHEYAGEPTVALFADLIVNRDALLRIRNNELPGRSAEIGTDPEAPEVRSLALLTSQPPFLRFAQLRSDTVTVQELATADDAVAAGFSCLATFADLRVSVADDTDTDDDAKGDAPAENPTAAKPDEDDTTSEDDEDGDDEETLDMAQVDALTKRLDTVESSLTSISTTMSALVAKLSPDPEAASKSSEDPATFADGEQPATFAAMEGRIAGLESQLAERSAREAAKTRTDAAVKDLRDGGWLVTDEIEAKIATFAAKGEDDLADFVDAYKLTKKDVTPDVEDALSTDDPLVAKFADADPDAVRAARAQFAELRSAGFGIALSEEAFIRQQVQTA